MPWQTQWHNDKQTTALMRGTTPWTWDELKDEASRLQAEIAKKSHRVHVIIELESDFKMPQTSSATDEWVAPWLPIRDILMHSPENRGLLIIVAPPLYVEDLLRNVKKLVRDQIDTDAVQFVKSMQEAEQIIAEMGG